MQVLSRRFSTLSAFPLSSILSLLPSHCSNFACISSNPSFFVFCFFLGDSDSEVASVFRSLEFCFRVAILNFESFCSRVLLAEFHYLLILRCFTLKLVGSNFELLLLRYFQQCAFCSVTSVCRGTTPTLVYCNFSLSVIA